MKLKGGQQYQFNQIKEDIQRELSRPNFSSTLFNAVNNIAGVINTIRVTKGHGWAAKVMDDNGQPVFTPVEQQRYTELFKPYVPSILSFFNEEDESAPVVSQHGGAEPAASASASASASVAAPLSKSESLKASASNLLSSAMSNFDVSEFMPDMLLDKIMGALMNVNNTLNKAAEAVNFSSDIDKMDDVILPIGAAGIPISPGLILFIIYCILDITRITIGVSGNETGRKVLSVLVAILEVIRGNWKKGLLSFVGYFGMSPMLMGQLLKTYLTVIQLLSPTLQMKLPYFVFDSLKSIVVGVIIAVIQIGAPKPVRDKINDLLKTLSDVKIQIDNELQKLDPPLSPRPDILAADFTNLNNIQSILDDPVYVCSKEHQDAVETLRKSQGTYAGKAMVELLLSLIRYPYTPGMTRYLCNSTRQIPYVELMVKEGLARKAAEEAEEQAAQGAPAEASAAAPVAAPPAAEEQSAPEAAAEKQKELPINTVNVNKKGGKRVLRKLRKSACHK